MKKIIQYIIKYYAKVTSSPELGRWKLKNCHTKLTNINSVYQNRDHCGDIICKTPIKADVYKN
tara:strand:+ start:184 stop:372 length:189 start_codon:yes stop_codon:yes gene_type:complete